MDDKKPVNKKITKRKLRAFQAKFDGKGYQEIAELTGYSRQTLETSLCPTGRWFAEYDTWREVQLNDIAKETKAAIQQNVGTALNVILTTLTMVKTEPRIALDAAKDVLDRGGFKPKEVVENATPEDIAEKVTDYFEKKHKKVAQPPDA